MNKMIMLFGIILVLAVPALASEGECVNTVSTESSTCLKSIEVAPYWVYSGELPNHVIEEMQSPTVASSEMDANSMHIVEVSLRIRSIQVAPYWVYVGPLPGAVPWGSPPHRNVFQ